MWYSKIVNDLAEIPNFLDFYEKELLTAKKEVRITGSIEQACSKLPAIVEDRFGQLQEIEAVLKFLNIECQRIRNKHYKRFLEGYSKALTSREAERFSDGENDVVEYEILINEVALLRNKWLGLVKSLDSKNYQLNNLVRLKVAGMEDFTIS